MNENENEKGFTVKDRRRFDASGNRREDAENEERQEAPRRQPAPPPQARQAPPPQQAQRPPQQAQRPPQAQQPPPQQARQAPPPPRSAMPPQMDDVEMDGMDEQGEGEAGPLGFAEFILSIATNAVLHMGGETKDGRVPGHINLPLAAQHIDIISMLAQKTRGNLTRDEAELMEALLYDLRMKYVSVAQSQTRGT
jgi:hypothetical protein